ncbi:MAG: hypothetical protein HY901_04125 [Deltaproteobacteria bacterium]|nr:hypothetical protein [Deltaproteobacteria bacterium]
MRLALLVAPALCLAGCLAPAAMARMPHVDEGGRYADRVNDPRTDRCAAQEGRRKKDCRAVRDQGLEFVRRLMVDDQICLEGNPMSDGISSRCKVRASVSDVGSNNVKLEIRHAAVGTRFKPMQNLWYTELALTDVYVASLGFSVEP